MAEKYKSYYPDPSETPAIDVMPASNGEYVPKDPTPAQRKIMALQSEKIEEVRRKFGMSRRQFVRTAAAFSVGVWAVDQVTGGKWGNYAFAQNTKTAKACDLENPGAQLANLPGEFILDTQGHALDSSMDAKWRTQDPGFSQFLFLWTSAAMGDYSGFQDGQVRGFGEGEIDPGLGALGGEGPTHNGWWFDDENGMAIVEHIRRIQQKTNRPAVVCTHKGLAFNGTFDSAKFSPRDMGVIAAQFPDITFFTYHSGYDGEHMKAYPGDDAVNSSNRGVDSFIKSLRENGVDATRFVPKGLEHGNSPNMYAEIGTTWWANMSDADRATHLLGKLITYVGPRRIVWGSDCIWYGNPQPQIVLLRALQFSDEAKQF